LAITGSITVATEKILDIDENATGSGTGTIIAEGDGSSGSITIAGVAGYTTTGVAGDDIADAVEAIAESTAALTNGIALTAFGDDRDGIGSVTIKSSGAAAIQDTGDGSANGAIAVTSGITLAAGSTSTTVTGTDGTTLSTSTWTLSINGTAVEILDGDWADGSAYLDGVVEFTGVQLKYSDLTGPVISDFHVGVKTRDDA
jgi:hypothetical protein